MKNNTPNITKTALLLTVLLALLALLSLLWISLSKRQPLSQPRIADIYQNGELLQSISLDTVEESYTFTIVGENGCQNEINVHPGSIGIISADCPDKLCVHQGFISSSLLPITCLPNHLVIQIRVEDTDEIETDSSIDIISY